MALLNFTGDISIEQVFVQNKHIIYDLLLKTINENYLDSKKNKIKVLTININEFEHSIEISRDKFISALNNAIVEFEADEEYEKCKRCIDIISDIKLKKLN